MNNRLKKFLEWTKLTAETAAAVLSFIKLLLVIAGTAALALMFQSDKFGKKEEQYLAQMDKFKQQSTQATRYADSLSAAALRQDSITRIAQERARLAQRQAQFSRTQTVALIRELDSIRTVVTDSVEMARVIIPKQDSVIQQQSITIMHQDTTIANLNSVILGKDVTIQLVTTARDSLQSVVNNIPSPPPASRITRKQAFVGGVVVGVILKMVVF
jgi:hypothetical protein